MADVNPDTQLDRVVSSVVHRSPGLSTRDTITEVARLISRRKGWVAVDDPNPRCARPAYLTFTSDRLYCSFSRGLLRYLISEARTAAGAEQEPAAS